MGKMQAWYPNILIIRGTGRNVGKTSLACAILRHLAPAHEVVAVKITPHPHPQPQGMVLLEQGQGWEMYQQVEVFEKDSSRMLAAGARVVYLVQCPTAKIPEAFNAILQRHEPHTLFLFESGGLQQHVDPGLSLVVTHTLRTVKETPDSMVYDVLLDEHCSFSDFVNKIDIDKSGWILTG